MSLAQSGTQDEFVFWLHTQTVRYQMKNKVVLQIQTPNCKVPNQKQCCVADS